MTALAPSARAPVTLSFQFLMMASSRRSPVRLLERAWLVGALYAAIGLAAFASTFDIFFMSDDFDFLGIVEPARSVLVIFEPLVGRFVRPLVVLLYYGNFHTAGLALFGYHLWT